MATSELAQSTLRVVLGNHELDKMPAERERLNLDVQQILDAKTVVLPLPLPLEVLGSIFGRGATEPVARTSGSDQA